MKIDWLIRFVFLSAVLVVLVSGCCFLFGCSSSKQVSKKETVYDSTAIREVQRLNRLLAEVTAKYEKQLYELSTAGIIFQTEYLPGDTVRLPGEVIIDKDGTIKAKGQLKSVLLTNERYSKEISLLHRKVDSLTRENEKNKNTVKTKEVIKEKKSKTKVYPWWLILACIVIGLLAENKLKVFARIKSIYSQFKK